jgi:hypothetical protein
MDVLTIKYKLLTSFLLCLQRKNALFHNTMYKERERKGWMMLFEKLQTRYALQ